MKGLAVKGIIVLSLLAFFGGCTSFAVDQPADFSQYKVHSDWYRAIAADGVRIRARLIKNESKGSASMWRTAALRHLKKSGYQETARKEFKTLSGAEASHSEYAYHYFGREFVYTVTLLVKEKHIGVIETTGETKYYEAHRESLMKAIKSFTFK